MSNEWTNLTDMAAVAIAHGEGWEIEVNPVDRWIPWPGRYWDDSYGFHGRPKQPKKVTVTSECWRNIRYGSLGWADPSPKVNDYPNCKEWQRFPSGDITGEVEE